jgi:serine/threonine protein kinase
MSASPSASPHLSPYSPGEVVAGKYRLKRLIGEGGMGAVWEARNLALEIDVAVKLIRADLNKETFGVRLRQEARAAAKLGHPAIVRVFDVGETELGDPFIVMELLEGRSLGALLVASGRIEPRRAVQLLLPIVDALSVAHSKGIVHRDLKPDNVFLSLDANGEQPKLLDFGIVKLEHDEGASHLTQVGTVLGSPDYLSPEQARGAEDIDHRVDIWSLGVTLYECVTGALPFVAPNYNALLYKILEHEPAPITELGVPEPELWDIIRFALVKSRDRRWQSMTELGKALAGWLFARGVLEDACGASLEARWLSRSTDPQGRPLSGARASFASFSGVGSYPSVPVRTGHGPTEPRSQRAVVRSLPFAPTVEQSGPPRRRWPLVAGVLAAGVAVGVGIFFATREEPTVTVVSDQREVSSLATPPSSVAPEVSVAEVPVPLVEPSTLPTSSSAPAASARARGRSRGVPAVKPGASAAASEPVAKPAPVEDLISPY